jgi:predicted GNAT family acetyltransferase
MAGASALDFRRLRDPAEFHVEAGPFLGAREAENNLILGLTANLVSGRAYGPEPPFFGVVRAGREVVGAAMRTPPFNLILAAGTSDDAVLLILEGIARETTDITGVIGPKDLARRAVALWAARTKLDARLQMAERIYALERVIPPRPAPGGMRAARDADRELLGRWFHAFVLEAQPHLESSLEAAQRNADGWIAGGRLRVWVDGEVVSMAGASGPTPHGIRVGAVYTPPELRRRGYASALVAALSQEQLDAGKRFCFLFTDLANPTSNKIYQDIGYEAVCDVDEYRFVGPTA